MSDGSFFFFSFFFLYSVLHTPNCSDNFIPFIPLQPQPGLYPFVFSFLQFFHYQLLCLQYQKSLILNARTIEKITPGDFFVTISLALNLSTIIPKAFFNYAKTSKTNTINLHRTTTKKATK